MAWKDGFVIEYAKSNKKPKTLSCRMCVQYSSKGFCRHHGSRLTDIGYDSWRRCKAFQLAEEYRTEERLKYINGLQLVSLKTSKKAADVKTATKVAATQAKMMQSKKNSDWVPVALRAAKVEFIDKRDNGGALWVVGDLSLSPLMKKLRDKGAKFNFSRNGGRVSKHQPAWFLKGYPSYIDDVKPNDPVRVEHPSKPVSPAALAAPRYNGKWLGGADEGRKVEKACSNCANMDSHQCLHGGFSLCANWCESQKNPDYWPKMRVGGKSWGSSERVESEMSQQLQTDADNRKFERSRKKQARKKKKSGHQKAKKRDKV